MPKYAMVIDLQKCVGCGACGIGCKTENNTQDKSDGQTFNWADFHIHREGVFPDATTTTKPVLCNHCTDAPCVEVCPVTPKSMFKDANGITMHNDERCIGCRLCQEACPYSATDVDEEKAHYSVISFNDFDKIRHPAYHDTSVLIQGCTTSGAEVAKKAGDTPPHHTRYRHPEYESVRRAGVSEKCIFCAHRVVNDLKPWCTVVCPSNARIFGDLNDPDSNVNLLLQTYKPQRLKNNKGEFLGATEKGVQPNVYYIRSYTRRKVAGTGSSDGNKA